jgi:hypothetical protein
LRTRVDGVACLALKMQKMSHRILDRILAEFSHRIVQFENRIPNCTELRLRIPNCATLRTGVRLCGGPASCAFATHIAPSNTRHDARMQEASRPSACAERLPASPAGKAAGMCLAMHGAVEHCTRGYQWNLKQSICCECCVTDSTAAAAASLLASDENQRMTPELQRLLMCQGDMRTYTPCNPANAPSPCSRLKCGQFSMNRVVSRQEWDLIEWT